ncbi:DNA-directed RNA polymerase subunit D [Nanoarchaeota archaeon]
MKLENSNWDKKKNQMFFVLKDTDESFANVIRRFTISQVPTLAVEDVDFQDNSSAFYDEIVAHRLGLTPIKTDLKSYNLSSECTCKGAGCAKCQLQITLKTGKRGIVLASEAKSKDPKCKFVYPDMPIVKLLAKQKLELVATAIMGQGKDHAKWSPGLVYYKKVPLIDINKKQLSDEDKKKLNRLSKDIFELSGSKLKFNQDKLLSNKNYEAYLEILEKAGVPIEDSPNSFAFHVESWGQLDCKQMLDTAADLFIQQLDEFVGLIK